MTDTTLFIGMEAVSDWQQGATSKVQLLRTCIEHCLPTVRNQRKSSEANIDRCGIIIALCTAARLTVLCRNNHEPSQPPWGNVLH